MDYRGKVATTVDASCFFDFAQILGETPGGARSPLWGGAGATLGSPCVPSGEAQGRVGSPCVPCGEAQGRVGRPWVAHGAACLSPSVPSCISDP